MKQKKSALQADIVDKTLELGIMRARTAFSAS